jgi:hypothetical protein
MPRALPIMYGKSMTMMSGSQIAPSDAAENKRKSDKAALDRVNGGVDFQKLLLQCNNSGLRQRLLWQVWIQRP